MRHPLAELGVELQLGTWTMRDITRRALLRRGTLSVATMMTLNAIRRPSFGAVRDLAKFTMDLRCSSIGVRADQRDAIRLGHKHGFESVTPDSAFLSDLSDESRARLLEEMTDKKLAWGAVGLPVVFHRDEATFADGIKRLPRLASGMQRAGVTRVGTWLSPSHSELTYAANFRQHTMRLGSCAKILADHGLRLGLEYIGPKTLRPSNRHGFIHSMAETKELIAEIGLDNVGFVLDSWHWYTAHETADDLRTLKNRDVIACDLNDAPAGIPVDQQIDNRRELPAATGVINLKKFLEVLVEIGYDGPIRAEPFNRVLNEMEDEMAVAATAMAMRNALAIVGNRPA
jgi:sugar phosphate isomerase/epimerase